MKGYTICRVIKLANLLRFKYYYYTHLGKTVEKKKSLSNLRTPKQRNCKILNCKAKETHLIPQELKYVFQLGYSIPVVAVEAHQNRWTQCSHCVLQAGGQLAPYPAAWAPVGFIISNCRASLGHAGRKNTL